MRQACTLHKNGFLAFTCNSRDFTIGIFSAERGAESWVPMTNKMDYLNALKSAIRMRHKCNPTHKQTVFVRANTKDQETVWEGDVEEFNLPGHETVKVCYAWQHMDPNGKSKIISVPGNTFIDSAQKAVQAAIFTDAQPPVRKFSDDLKWLTNQLHEFKEMIRNMGIKSEELSVSIDATRQIKENAWRKSSHDSGI
jgi:hypothetical protein